MIMHIAVPLAMLAAPIPDRLLPIRAGISLKVARMHLIVWKA